MTEHEIQRLLHELQVHQVELEMQNSELRQARDDAEAALGRYTDLYDFAPVGYFTLDRSGIIRAANFAGTGLLEETRVQLLGRRFDHFVAEEDLPTFGTFLGKVFAGWGKEECEAALLNKSKTPLIVQIEAMTAASGQECNLALIDITERKRAEERINEVLWQQQAILDNSPNVAWLKDREGRYAAVNVPFGRLFGLTPKDLVGKCDYDLYPPQLALKYEIDFKEVMATGKCTSIEESLTDPEGRVTYFEKVETPIFNDKGLVIGIIGVAYDVTSHKEVEVTLRYDGTHDVMTGLYNRGFFEEELERLARGRMFPLSILMADINGLKKTNDTLGHEAGDSLIRLAAQIILGAFRSEDIVARIGGDEFAVLLPRTGPAVAEEAVERIMKCPEITSGQVSIAFGIASATNQDQLTTTLQLSDKRMYLNKTEQKNCRKASGKDAALRELAPVSPSIDKQWP
ncbi:MAG: GGDEF domain-containing protein [Desulfobulbaceae bacterium]|nr:GGDEF domain-containing protein [Desulfobulbaceae bacterium]